MVNSRILNKAKQVRDLMEKGIADKKLLASLYKEYADIDDIQSFVARAEEMFPKLNCGLASVYLKHELGEGKIVNGKFKNENHTFLLLDDGNIADITADQYGGPEIYYGPLREPWLINC